MSEVRIFGIRHHGPGSARSLVRELDRWRPDALLVEGPPDAAGALPLVARRDLKPPVALLVYARDEPSRAVFYPFAEFSPEWQALLWGSRNDVVPQFMDLPQAHRLAPPSEDAADGSTAAEADEEGDAAGDAEEPEEDRETEDLLDGLARAAGHGDGERWWEALVEHRRGDDGQVFEAVLEAMAAVREGADPEELDARREAFMRKTIRAAIRQKHERVAVVCGAYHAPALAHMPTVKHDQALLRGLPRTKTEAAWVPWTYDRLSTWSGYGAGVESPEWYHLLWKRRKAVASRWMIRVARLMRDRDLDASSAHVIEAVRLAEALSALRDLSLPGLAELNEAARTVLCFGQDTPMELVRRKLVVGERMGAVPEDAPRVPLHQDLTKQQKRLRMQPKAERKALALDLRKPNDLARSHLLHRLLLLDVPWGKRERVHGKKGTFHEHWALAWKPEFVVRVIVGARWGNTVAEAASNRVVAEAASSSLETVTGFLDDALLADLPDAVRALTQALQEKSTAANVDQLMDAAPRLVRLARYGNVRQTDAEVVRGVVDGLLTRICVGLRGACYGLNEDTATSMLERIIAVHRAVDLLRDASHTKAWQRALLDLADSEDQGANLHGLVVGRACRVLHDSRFFEPEETARRFSLALSRASDPIHAGAWIEGFLQDGGLLLIHDLGLWRVVDGWISGIAGEVFDLVLPLLRRTFSTFEGPERRQMGERVRRGDLVETGTPRGRAELDPERGAAALPLIARLLGLEVPHGS